MTDMNNPERKDLPQDEEQMDDHNQQENTENFPDTGMELDDGDDPLAPTDIDQKKTDALEKELDQTKDQMMRALAEAENTRRRSLKDREDIRKYAVSEFAKDLLDFSDNFQRALEAIPAELMESDERIKNVLTGINAMETELLKTFDKHGIKKIEPLDEPFDPNFHEVMFESPGTGKAAGIIVQIIEPGYVLHDRLLRPARVGIAKDEGQGNTGNNPQNDPGSQIDTEA